MRVHAKAQRRGENGWLRERRRGMFGKDQVPRGFYGRQGRRPLRNPPPALRAGGGGEATATCGLRKDRRGRLGGVLLERDNWRHLIK